MIDMRLEAVDWDSIELSLTQSGFARLPRLLSVEECADFVTLYNQANLFRTRVDMTKFRFGQGEYKYFSYPLPPLIEDLRQGLYSKLVNIANTWADITQLRERFPLSLGRFLERCHQRGQLRPTPLMLRYSEGGFNCLHQDIYGEITFPFQVTFFLSQPRQDYSGGEFLLVEDISKSQTIGRAFLPEQGEGLVLTTRHHPIQGKHGIYKATIRHGVSPVLAGERWTLGIIFHDSK